MTRKMENEEEKPVPKMIRIGDSPEEHKQVRHKRKQQIIPTQWFPLIQIKDFHEQKSIYNIQSSLNGLLFEMYSVLSQVQFISNEMNQSKQHSEESQSVLIPQMLDNNNNNNLLDFAQEQVAAILRELETIKTFNAVWPVDDLLRKIHNFQDMFETLISEKSMEKPNNFSNISNVSIPQFSRNTTMGSEPWNSLASLLNKSTSINGRMNSYVNTNFRRGLNKKYNKKTFYSQYEKRKREEETEDFDGNNMDYYCYSDPKRCIKRARRILFIPNHFEQNMEID